MSVYSLRGSHQISPYFGYHGSGMSGCYQGGCDGGAGFGGSADYGRTVYTSCAWDAGTHQTYHQKVRNIHTLKWPAMQYQ